MGHGFRAWNLFDLGTVSQTAKADRFHRSRHTPLPSFCSSSPVGLKLALLGYGFSNGKKFIIFVAGLRMLLWAFRLYFCKICKNSLNCPTSPPYSSSVLLIANRLGTSAYALNSISASFCSVLPFNLLEIFFNFWLIVSISSVQMKFSRTYFSP